MAVINGSGDNSNGIAHGVAVSLSYAGMSIPSDGTLQYSSAVGLVETVNVIRPTTGQMYPRGDGVPTT